MMYFSNIRVGLLGSCLGLALSGAALAGEYNLTVDRVTIDTGDFTKTGIGYNGSSTPTVLRFKEGEQVTINVTNNLDEDTSVHWHGLILPFEQDGVPEISYPGIKPGETFTYSFPIVQSGTYWFHSHSGFQEPDGAYGALILEPKEPEPYGYDRDYVVQLTDSHPHDGDRIMRNLKMMPDYYNRQQRTLLDLFDDASEKGLDAALSERANWGEMRMMPTDIEDVQGFTPLINGKGPAQNWTGLFKPGERVRLRFINSSAMAYFDVRIPGLKMTVVQADGNDVLPVEVDEFRIAVAETYDVIVQPQEDKAFTIFAESMGRTAFARGTLAPREGMEAEVPELREPPLLTMADMAFNSSMAGMEHGAMNMAGMDQDGMKMEGMDQAGMNMEGMDQAGMKMEGMDQDGMKMEGMDQAGMNMEGMDQAGMKMEGMDQAGMKMEGMDQAGMNMEGMDQGSMKMAEGGKSGSGAMMKNEDMPAGAHQMTDGTVMGGMVRDPFYAAGSGLTPVTADENGKFLSYKDLKAAKPLYPDREATREIELRLTGNMERYSWSINGIKYDDSEPIRLQYGERVRFKFVNETMMTHPMHLHGMWTIIDNGNGEFDPIKHTVSIAPGTVVYTETEVDAPGQWAFHCHLSYHADAGMFRMVVVEGGPDAERAQLFPASGG